MKWKNILLAIIFIICTGVMVKDFYMLTIYPFISGVTVGLTWFGLFELVISITAFIAILEYFKDEIK